MKWFKSKKQKEQEKELDSEIINFTNLLNIQIQNAVLEETSCPDYYKVVIDKIYPDDYYKSINGTIWFYPLNNCYCFIHTVDIYTMAEENKVVCIVKKIDKINSIDDIRYKINQFNTGKVDSIEFNLPHKADNEIKKF